MQSELRHSLSQRLMQTHADFTFPRVLFLTIWLGLYMSTKRKSRMLHHNMSASGALIFGATNVTITLPLRTWYRTARPAPTPYNEAGGLEKQALPPTATLGRSPTIKTSYVAWSSSVDGRGITRQLANSSILYGKPRLVRIR